MLKLTRLHFAECGYPDGYFDGDQGPIDFTDSRDGNATGAPQHHAMHAVNGLCKTSLLSLFFALFEPRKDRFLRALIDGQEQGKFEHYFRRGKVGFVVAEFVDPSGSLLTGPEDGRVVVGMAVHLLNTPRENGDTLDRRFFAFVSRPGLTFDALPVRGLNQTGGELVRRGEAMRAWLHTLGQTVGGDGAEVFVDTNQENWKTKLYDLGLDPQLMAIQKNFNIGEGAVGKEWLNFQSEKDFVQKFCELVYIMPRRANDDDTAGPEGTRQLIANQVEKLRMWPDRRQQEHLLGRLESAAQGFSEAAAEWLGNRDDLGRQEAKLAAYGQEARGRKAAAESERDAAEARRAAQETAAQEAEQRAVHAAGEVLYLQRRWAEIGEATARAEAAKAQEACDKADERIAVVEAALARAETQRLKAEKRALERNRAQARKDIEPLEQELKLAGSQLVQLLRAEKNRLTEQLRETERDLSQARSEAQTQDQAYKQKSTELGNLRATIQQHEATLERISSELEQLRADGYLGADEVPADGLQRLDDALSQARKDDAERQQQETEARKTRDDAAQTVAAAREREQGHQRHVAELDQQLQEEAAARQAINEHDCTKLFLDAPLEHPDHPEVAERVDQQIEDHRRAQNRWGNEITRLKADADFIGDTGLSQPDEDVQTLLDALHAADVQAVSFEHYLAEMLPDADAAGSLVAKDPARFTGVGVYAGQMDKAREVVTRGGHRLRGPVVVSEVTLDAEAPTDDRMVAPPLTEARFNKDAAEREARRIENELANARQEHHNVTVMLTGDEDFRGLEDLRDRLRDYTTRFGHGRLATLQRNREEAAESRDAEKRKAEQAESNRAQAEQDLGQIAEAREALSEHIDALKTARQAVASHMKRNDDVETKARAELPDLRTRATSLEEELPRIEDALKKASDSRERLVEQASQIRSKIEGLDERVVEVKYRRDDEADLPSPELGRESLAERYSELRDSYNKQQDAQIAVLDHQIGEKQSAISQAETDYETAARDLDTDRIEALGTDKDKLVDEQARAYQAHKQARETRDQKEHGRQGWESEIRVADDRIKQARTDKRRPIKPVTVEGTETWDVATAKRAIDEHERKRDDAEADRDERRRLAGEAKDEKARQGERVAKMNAEVQRVDAREPTAGETDADPAALSDAQLSEAIGSAIAAVKSAVGNSQKAWKKVESGHTQMQTIVNDDEFRRLEPRIAANLTGSQPAAIAENHERLVKKITDRLGAVRNELAYMEADKDKCVTALEALAESVSALLQQASRMSQIPQEVPQFGGMNALKVGFDAKRVESQQRRQNLEVYLTEMVRENVIPASGFELATECLMRVAGGSRASLNIRILKPKATSSEKMIEIHKVSFSGGERITAAMLLYSVVQQLRAMNRVQAKRIGSGGVLVLDNPIGAANRIDLVDLQMTMAERMGLQLIIATPTEEKHLLDKYPTLSRLVQGPLKEIDGKNHTTVRIAGYTLEPAGYAA